MYDNGSRVPGPTTERIGVIYVPHSVGVLVTFAPVPFRRMPPVAPLPADSNVLNPMAMPAGTPAAAELPMETAFIPKLPPITPALKPIEIEPFNALLPEP